MKTILIIPLLSIIAGILLERFGNIGIAYAGGLSLVGILGFLLVGCIISFKISNKTKYSFRSRQIYRKVTMSRLFWIPLSIMFVGLGITAAFLSPRSSLRIAKLSSDYNQWISELPDTSRLEIKVTRVTTGEYGDYITGEILSPMKWKGWIIGSGNGVTDIKKGEIIEISGKSVNGGIGRKNETIKLEEREKNEKWYETLHFRFCRFIDVTPLDETTKGLLKALLAGESDAVDISMRKSLSDAGLAHILALSGMHVGIAAGIILVMLWPLNILGWWKIRLVGGVILIWIFVALSGMADSTLRAALMLTAGVITLIVERERNAFNTLMIAALLILLLKPDALFSIGFQLSFITVAGLIAFMEPLNPIDHRKHPALYKSVAWLLLPMIATLCSWALVSYYFGSIPVGFLPLNLIAVPLMPVYIVMVLIYLILFNWGWNFEMLGDLIDYLPALLRKGAEYIGQDTVIEFQLEGWMVICWLGLLAITGIILHRNSRTSKPLQPDQIT